MRKIPQAEQAADKGPHSFCHSERSYEFLFLFMGLNRREIPRFARNDKINTFSAAFEACWVFVFSPCLHATNRNLFQKGTRNRTYLFRSIPKEPRSAFLDITRAGHK